MNRYDLSQKHILFIGGQTGLDRTILALLQDSISSPIEENKSSCNGQIVCYNQLEIGNIENELKEVIKNNGTFDGVVFNIVHSDFRPLQFVKPELVNQITNDNYAVFVEVIRVLKKCRGLSDGASIVAMSSISSSRAMKAKMAFCASKAALDATVRCLAVELADRGIRVNSIQKGAVDTDFEKSHIQDISSVRSDETNKHNEAPLGIVKADEIAQAVAFLLSDAVKTITGTSIVIDGGYLA